MNWELFFSAIGLAFVMEGVAYGLLSKSMLKRLIALVEQSDANRRVMGLTLAIIGVAIIYAVKSIG